MTGDASGRIDIERFDDPAVFLEAAVPFLVAREAEHNLILGIASSLVVDPGRVTGSPYLALARRAGTPVGAAVMTPPFNVVLSCMDDEAAIAAFATDLASRGPGAPPPPGVTGPVEVAAAFGRVWAPPRELAVHRSISERIYRIERLIPPAGIRGSARVATAADRDLIVAWCQAFLVEALGRTDPTEAVTIVDRGMRTGSRTFYLWEDGSPVSLAGSNGPTPNGIRIGPVYTPPERRGHGYGSAVTAAATQAQFDAGRRYVFLFTDLANPTSNKIYRSIGYEPVIDVDQLSFEGIDGA
ncbi:MAG TPA: GNAT family N-acetyltransferase [Candidatus Limnocylindrales bacterium]|nr:GNAT family N-acetyltransferase [Candidatus Limnocylindrales bacterium]